MTLRIDIDQEECMSYGKCVADQPDAFAFDDDVYRTAPRRIPWFSRIFPTCNFYRKFCWNVYRSSVKARRGEYSDSEWVESSRRVLESLESVLGAVLNVGRAKQQQGPDSVFRSKWHKHNCQQGFFTLLNKKESVQQTGTQHRQTQNHHQAYRS